MLNTKIIPVSKILADENQPRKYFAANKMAILKKSVAEDGILSPLIVEKMKGSDNYRLVDGERRFRVAVQNGLKEVPCVEIETANDTERLVKQYQIQEMHENWTPIERALAVLKLVNEMKIPISKMADIIGLSEGEMRAIIGFANIVNKEAYVENDVPLEYAKWFVILKNRVKKVRHSLKKPFERSEEKALERALIERVGSQDIKKHSDVTKIGDSIVKDPSYFEKFLETKISPEKMFYETDAVGVYNVRNLMNHSTFIHQYILKFLEKGDMKLTKEQVSSLKYTRTLLAKVLDKVE